MTQIINHKFYFCPVLFKTLFQNKLMHTLRKLNNSWDIKRKNNSGWVYEMNIILYWIKPVAKRKADELLKWFLVKLGYVRQG